VLVQQRAYGVRDLPPAPVPHGDVDLRPADPLLGTLLGGLERGRRLGGQQVERTDHAQPPGVALLGELYHQVLDDLQQRVELAGWPAKVVGGEQIEGNVPDTGLIAPVQHMLDLGSADPVTVIRVDVAHLSGPSPVAVAHDTDMPRYGLASELRRQPPLVHGVEKVPHSHPLQRSDPS
jgi:hypothetical protein